MLVLTPKEIETVGNNRYMRERGRYWKVAIVFFSVLLVAFVVGLLTQHMLPTMVNIMLTLLVLLIGFGYFGKVYMHDAAKAGKKFREQWEKERLMAEGYRHLSGLEKEKEK